jgi:flagellar hook-length control protein FliK
MNEMQIVTTAVAPCAAGTLPAPAEPGQPDAPLQWTQALQAALLQQAGVAAADTPLDAKSADTALAAEGGEPVSTDHPSPSAADVLASPAALLSLPPIVMLPPPLTAAHPAVAPSISTAGATLDRALAGSAPSGANSGLMAAHTIASDEEGTGTAKHEMHMPTARHETAAFTVRADTQPHTRSDADTAATQTLQAGSTPTTQAPAPALTVAAVATASPPLRLQIDAAVGTAAWNTDLGQQVTWMVREKIQVAELHLNPPDLGPLDIKLTVGEHETTAVFTSPHGAVREAIESALPRLREVLAESGVTLGNTSVTADSSRDGPASDPSRQPARREADGTAADSAAIRGPLSDSEYGMRRNGLVDLFA